LLLPLPDVAFESFEDFNDSAYVLAARYCRRERTYPFLAGSREARYGVLLELPGLSWPFSVNVQPTVMFPFRGLPPPPGGRGRSTAGHVDEKSKKRALFNVAVV